MEVTIVRSKQVPQVGLNIPKMNEKQWPASYKCNFLEPGIVSYEDVGQGIALLKKESMDNWIQSFKGKPVIIDHQNVNPSNFKEAAVGYITNVLYNSQTGWYDAEFIITDDEGHEAIKNGYSVSCSFDVKNSIGGGEWHASKYDEEITQGEGLHLALVTSPRYEDCRIVVNSKKATINDEKYKVTVSIDGDAKDVDEVELANPYESMSNVELEAKLRQIPGQMAIEPNTEAKMEMEADSKLISQEIERRRSMGEYNPTNEKEEVTLEKKNDTDFAVMSSMQRDKYMETLSDVGLQSLVDGEYPGDIKKLASAHIGDRAKKLQAEEIAGATGAKPIKKKEASKMWGLFAKKADKASIKNDKIDATKVFVKVDNEMVPLSTLMNSVGSDFELLQESDAVKINGKDVSVADLVKAYKTKSNEFPPKEKEKEEEEVKEKVKEDGKKCDKCGAKLNEFPPKEKEEEEVKKDAKEEEEEEKEIKKDEKALPNPQTDEGDTVVKKNGKEFFMELENAKLNGQPNLNDFGSTTATTREDRAANGKKFFGSRKR